MMLHSASRRTRIMIAVGIALVIAAGGIDVAHAQVTGGVDPQTGLRQLGSWIMSLVAIVIPIICAIKGAHAVAEGRHLGPYIAGAVGGMALAFGGAYLLSHYG